jgi:hypothetical protein
MNTPIYQGKAQSDIDMAGFDLLNWSGGGGGGGGGATFFLQAPSVMIVIRTNANIIHLRFRCFTLLLRTLGAQ